MVDFSSLINKIHLGSVPDFLDQIPDETVSLTFTSPPYYDDELYIIENGEKEFGWGTYDEYLNHLLDVTGELYRVTIPSGKLVLVLSNTPQTDEENHVRHYWPIIHDLISRCKDQGWEMSGEVIWVKDEPTYNYIKNRGPPETQITPNHDIITILRKTGNRRLTTDKKLEKSVWHFPKAGPIESYNKWYPSFPSKLARKVIELWSLPNDIVLDPYAGSGQVIRIAMSMNRFAIGIETDKQWQKLWKDINS